MPESQFRPRKRLVAAGPPSLRSNVQPRTASGAPRSAALARAPTTTTTITSTTLLSLASHVPPMAAPTPTLDAFLSAINSFVRSRNALELRNHLVIEPPYADAYHALIAEARSVFPRGGGREEALEERCAKALEVAREGMEGAPSWTAFVKVVVAWVGFLRDVDTGDLGETYRLLGELLQKCNSALSHPQGVLILPTVVNYSRVLSRLAIGLDKQPHLIASLAPNSSSPNNDTGTRETLPERAANILRQAFVTCLNDRSGSTSGLTRDGAPDGKKRGIYTIANLCLKILFACRKTRGAAQIFENIYNQSPPLAAYPKSERVTYLYYLGRFLWANGHFYRALLALQQAYNDCHPQALQQRRLILIYLMASNIVCARFPAEALYARPEARGLRERFEPLCQAIRRGDVYAFRRHLDDGSKHYRWFSFYRLDVQLRNRCEPFVWRSLVRKTFILSGDPGNPERRVAPTVDLNHVLTLLRWMEIRYRTPPGASQPQVYIDPDFQGLPGIDTMSEKALGLPTMMSVMSKMSSLINQDFLNGYLSYGRHKLAIQGARQKGALAAGFPVMWKVIEARGGEEVPGWKKEQKVVPQAGGAFGGGMRAGPGMVVNLSGARPVGSFG